METWTSDVKSRVLANPRDSRILSVKHRVDFVDKQAHEVVVKGSNVPWSKKMHMLL